MLAKYRKKSGADFEREEKNRMLATGWPFVARQASSLFPDLVALDVFGDDLHIAFVECKNSRDGKLSKVEKIEGTKLKKLFGTVAITKFILATKDSKGHLKHEVVA